MNEEQILRLISKMREILNENRSLSLNMNHDSFEVGRTGLCLDDGFDFSLDIDFSNERLDVFVSHDNSDECKKLQKSVEAKLNEIGFEYGIH